MSIKSLKQYIFSNDMMYIITGIYMLTLLLGNVVYYFSSPIFEITVKSIKIVCYVAFLFFIIKDWKNGESITIGMLVFAAISAFVCFFSKNKDLIFLFIFCFAIRKLEFKKIIFNTFKIYLICFSVVVILSLLNIVPDLIFLRGNYERHSLGFYYSTIAIGVYLSIILMYFYIRRSNAKILELLLLEIINVFLYKYTDGRLSFILISVILFMMLISKVSFIKKCLKSRKMQNILKYIGYFLPLLMFLLVVVITVLYSRGTSLGLYINKLLSSRLLYTKNAFQEYGITVFGEPISWNGWGGFGYVNIDNMSNFKYNFVDISYARIMFDYGIIPTILILSIYTIALVKNLKEKEYWMFTALILVCVWSLIEPYIFNVGKNIFILSFIPIYNFGRIRQLDYNNLKSKFKRENKNEKFNN